MKQSKRFMDWFNDGNVIQRPDGTYSTQDALWMNRIRGMKALKKYFTEMAG
jgi:hypothetical protein